MEQAKQATILVVDDDEAGRKLLESIIATDGYAVRTAASGEDALASVAEQLPDLVLLDVMMPGIDGFEVARRLKADSRSRPVPIILVTALDDRASRINGLEAGADDFLAKPVDRTELQVRVSNLLKIKEYNDFLANHGRVLEEQLEARSAEELLHELRVHQVELEMQNETLRQVHATLEESRNIYLDLYDFAPVGYLNLTREGMISKINLTGAALLGVERKKLLNRRFAGFVNPDDGDCWHRHFLRTLQHKDGQRCELAIKRGDDTVFYVQLDLLKVGDDNEPSVRIALTDITERKQAEAEIRHANRALATMSAVNRTLVHATDERELLQAICQIIVEQKGYRMAWVGYGQHDEGKSVKIMARAGHDDGYLEAMQLSWAEAERGMSPCGCAIRSGATQVCQDIANDPRHLPWRDAALERGYAASIALPLTRRDGKVFGTLAVYSDEVNAFIPAEINLLEEMAGDLAFGVNSLHVRCERDLALEQNRQQLAQLQDSLDDTVKAISTMLEMRDPYTAGHQTRVADLAAAIARQMGLSDEQIHGIHLAGMLHDLGKIQIPSEILSKPGKISAAELTLIKLHPQAGHDILQGIDFPWPIAQMVLQHHERIDGSGYPRGLKGEAILPGARILGVADVVEAMASHRPYRPGLGIETALEEIARQRGIYFDPQVVDACLALFREQCYTL